jgi:hypothetical protein
MAARVAPSPLSTDARWEVVQRVAASASFQRSPRLRELLLYICERAIQNRPEELREQLIGRGVFGRKPDYNPSEDNIVRVEMRQLRKRLEEYFVTEGKDEQYVVMIPKGAYLPVLEPRQPRSVAVVPRPEPANLPNLFWLRWAASVAILVLAGVCLWLVNENRNMQHRLAAVSKVDRAALWPLLFNNGQETLIVCADSTLVVAETVLHRSVTLDEYLSHDYTAKLANSDSAKSVLRSLPNWLFTDMTDVRLVQRLFRLNGDHWDKVSIRSAKNTQVQDFKQANIILLGSVRSNPWGGLFEPALKFRFEYDEQAHAAYIRNMQPKNGEQPVYQAASPGQSGYSYSVIALVPNLRKTGYVLMIAGTTGEGTESAGEFIMNPATASGLFNNLSASNKGRIPYFEILLKSGTLAGVAKNAEIVAEHIIPD